MLRRAVFGLVLFVASPALAQSTPIEVGKDAEWTHQWTSFVAPPQLAGLERVGIVDQSSGQTNISASYQDAKSGTSATVQIFRPGLMSVAIWKDRSLLSLSGNKEGMGRLDLTQTIAGNFTPRSGGGKDSGYIAYGPLTGGSATSMGMALFPQDTWLVKIQMSSNTLAADALAQKLVGLLSAIELPKSRIAYPPTADIADCRGTLAFGSGEERGDLHMPILNMVGASATQARSLPPPQAPAPKKVEDAEYCRDSGSTAAYGIYRPKGDDKAFVIAIGDAGLAASVAPFVPPPFLDGRPDRYQGTGSKEYWPMVMNEERTNIYAPFQGLPSPGKILDMLRAEAPVEVVEFAPDGTSKIVLPSLATSQ